MDAERVVVLGVINLVKLGLPVFKLGRACRVEAVECHVRYSLFESSMVPISSLPPFMVCGDADRCVTMSILDECVNICVFASVSKTVSWRGDHVVSAMAGFRYRFHTRKPEPSYKRV
uniref:Uncharacterized protein n=1 Tax=Tanacetum cinerariifolium TaxID=118510 RepID=A0A6L2L5H9_TANCI|nr:hypothetical protein [Tanacetum cinerariifolium]